MRFVSSSNRFTMSILARRAEILPGGVEREVQPGFTAIFTQDDIRPADIEFAERRLNLHGRTTEIDEVTPTPLYIRLSTYDTDDPREIAQYEEIDRVMEGEWLPGGRERWEPGSTKAYVERWMLNRCGQYVGYVEEILAPPWPNYERFPGGDEDLVGVILDQGFHLPPVIAYERANQNRAVVIEGLEEALAKQGGLTEYEALAANPAEYVS